MKNLKKGLSILTFAFVMVISLSVVNVNAADYDLATEMASLQAGNPLEINVGDTLTYGDEEWVGRNGRLNVTSGTLTITYNDGGTPGMTVITDDMVNFTVDGITVVNPDKRFIVQADLSSVYPGVIIPINLTVNEGAQLYVNGRLAMPSGANSVLVNNGTVNVNGNLEIRTASHYTGTGALNVYGNVAVYGADGKNIDDNVRFNIYENGNVYSEADLTGKLISGLADNDEYTYEVVDNNKTYTSISPDVNVDNTFEYGYTLNKTAVEKPAEDVTEEPVKDETENPKTSDGIILTISALAVSGMVALIAKKKLA